MSEEVRAMADLQQRFNTPLYTVSEAARYLGVPVSTLTTWGRGYLRRRPSGVDSVGAPIVTFVGKADGGAVVPFVGLAEGLVLAAFRRAGVPLQRVRPALQRIQQEFGIEHALASKRLYADGAEVLYDFAERSGDTPEGRSARELVVIRHGQRVFAEVVDAYLHRVEFAADGYARLIRLPQYHTAEVVADPDRGFGQPVFTHGGARVEDVLSMFKAGEPLEVVSEEFGVPLPELEDAVRVALQPAA
jgi:uncharacterized protein (DUF433 family)